MSVSDGQLTANSDQLWPLVSRHLPQRPSNLLSAALCITSALAATWKSAYTRQGDLRDHDDPSDIRSIGGSPE